MSRKNKSNFVQLIHVLLDEYAADETGQADYALEANGKQKKTNEDKVEIFFQAEKLLIQDVQNIQMNHVRML